MTGDTLRNFSRFLSEYTPSFVQTMSILFSFSSVSIGSACTWEPIKTIGKDKLGMFHFGENHRGYLGSGHINFEETFKSLKEINYSGIITFESFSSEVVDPVLSNTLAVWRNLWSNSEDLAAEALKFIKNGLRP